MKRLALLLLLIATPAHASPKHHDPRPAKWCGWFMRHLLHVQDKSYNRAAKWKDYGEPANGPGRNVIVVWPHHVGLIKRKGHTRGRWVVLSGNDGHRVRERERSLKGAIAFRRSNYYARADPVTFGGYDADR